MLFNSNPKVSIIIPVYNSDKFLKKCLQSIIEQTFKDFEVIILDDGSTDSSFEIIKDFCSKYENFSCEKLSHNGQGIARNIGIKKAKGEFLAFIDSDDFVSKDFLYSLYYAAKNNDADISCCSLKLYYPQYNLSLPFPTKQLKSGVYDADFVFAKIVEDVQMNSFPWNKLFKRSLFIENNCEFRNMYFEDMVLIPELFFYSNRVAVISKSMYNYTQHRESTLGSMDKKKINDYICAIELMKLFLERKKCYREYEKEFKTRASKAKLINYVTEFRLHFMDGSFKSFNTDLKNIKNSIDKIC